MGDYRINVHENSTATDLPAQLSFGKNFGIGGHVTGEFMAGIVHGDLDAVHHLHAGSA
jgi:hypothetical protein